jgi:predicted DNA-binding protein
METGTGTEKTNGKGRGRRSTKPAKDTGRMDADKQPMVKKPQIVAERLDELVELANKASTASERAKEAVTKCAEDSGFLASAVNKLVRAKAGDKFEEKHREVEQQKELFDEAAE